MNHGEPPVVSVCIANYNGEVMLPDCIDSVMRQRSAARLEVIVHDDASTDASVSLLHSEYPDVTVIRSESNVGFCIANNRMAEVARGRFLLLLNNDAALFTDAIDALLRASSDGQCTGVLSLPQYDWYTGKLIDRGCLLDPFYTPVPNMTESRSEVAYVIGACLWIERSVWNDLGGFPSWMESIAEDLFLGCVARLSGYPVRCLPRSGYRHRQGASFGGNRIDGALLSSNYRRRYLSERNRLAVMITCTPTPVAGLWLVAQLMSIAVECIVLMLAMRSFRPFHEIYGRAVADVWRWRTLLLQYRRRISSSRRIGLAAYLGCFLPVPRKLQLVFRHGIPLLR